MRIITVFLVVFIIGCSNSRQFKHDNFYESTFYFYEYNEESHSNDLLIIDILQQINKTKKALIDQRGERNEVQSVHLIMCLKHEYGATLYKYVDSLNRYDSSFAKKYNEISDCEFQSLDQALFYLTNLEKDVLILERCLLKGKYQSSSIR